MKLAIDITEDKFDLIRMAAISGLGDFTYKIIANGTPIPEEKKEDVIFTGAHAHYELRNETHNYQMVTSLNIQNSQEGIKAWFKENYSKVDLPKGKYVIVKVTENVKVEKVEELEEVL